MLDDLGDVAHVGGLVRPVGVSILHMDCDTQRRPAATSGCLLVRPTQAADSCEDYHSLELYSCEVYHSLELHTREEYRSLVWRVGSTW